MKLRKDTLIKGGIGGIPVLLCLTYLWFLAREREISPPSDTQERQARVVESSETAVPDTRQQTNAPVQPARLSFEVIGAPMMNVVKVTWSGQALIYEKTQFGLVLTNRMSKPSKQQWREFWTATEKVQLSKWQRRYMNPDVLDGWVWSIGIKHGTQVFNTMGSNATPDDEDVKKTLKDISPSQTFIEFKIALEKLLGFNLW